MTQTGDDVVLRSEAYLDTENLFHGLSPARTALSPEAAAVLRSLRGGPLDSSGDAGTLLRTLRDIVTWMRTRSGTMPDPVHSYGKSVDPAVRLLRQQVRDFGDDYRERTRGTTPSHGSSRPLVDFDARIALSRRIGISITHVDVPEGPDQAELRLISDLKALRRGDSLPDRCLLGSADRKVFRYVHRLADDQVRDRFFIVIPRAAAGLLRVLPIKYPHLRPEHVAVADRLRVLADKAVQDPRAPARPRIGRPDAPQPRAATAERLTQALRTADWIGLAGLTPDDPQWKRLLGGLADAVARSFADPSFARRFEQSRRAATISRARAGELDARLVRFLVSCAVLYDALGADLDLRVSVRARIATGAPWGFLRSALEAIQPLLASSASAAAAPRAIG